MKILILMLICCASVFLIAGQCSDISGGGSINKGKLGPPKGFISIWKEPIGNKNYIVQSFGPWASNNAFTQYVCYLVTIEQDAAGNQWVEKDPTLRSVITQTPFTFVGYFEVRSSTTTP